jgi:hypothetical protein
MSDVSEVLGDSRYMRAIRESVRLADERLAEVDDDARERVREQSELAFSEKASLLDVNAQTRAQEQIPLDVSVFLYSRLSDWDQTPLGERVVVLQVMRLLLERRLGR